MKHGFVVDQNAALEANRSPYYGHGKLEVLPKVTVEGLADIATLYTPGVAYSVQEILRRPDALHELSAKDNTIAVVTDGTAVLGLGRAGPRAALPVMEGKAAMFKLLVGIDAVPLCLDVQRSLDLVGALAMLEPNFGGYNIEDVAAPGCFEVMEALESRVDIPCIHDDQYGTATVAIAALTNAWKLLGRDPRKQRVVINGAGAAGTAIFDLLRGVDVGDITVCDRKGILAADDKHDFAHHSWIAGNSNAEGVKGTLKEAIRGADVFIGVSVADQVTREMVQSMRPGPIVLALANPVPEIMPEEAAAGGAAIVATGRFDYPNQCNNVLAFPPLMRAALDAHALRLDREVYLAAARAIAAEVPDATLTPSCILPGPLSETLYPNAAEATARAIVSRGLARVDPIKGAVAANTQRLRALVRERQQILSRYRPRRVVSGGSGS